MGITKRLIAVTLAVFAAASMVMGQSSSGEKSVEQSYLQDAVERMIIQEQSRADSRDMKLVALEYIGEAIDRGNAGPEIQNALDYLALEGILYKTREGGRVAHNYPEIRTKAATYLGDLGTAEAKNTLIKIVMADPEPMVLTEAVKSLAKIGINENDETINTISWIVTRFDVLHPDNLLALSALEAYEALSANGGIKDGNAIKTIMRIADNASYIRPVQDRAKALLVKLRSGGSGK